jgi:hypothetical protein
VPDDLPLPAGGEKPSDVQPAAEANFSLGPRYPAQPWAARGTPEYTAPRPYSRPRQPVFMRNASSPNNPPSSGGQSAPSAGETGLIGPVGYDVQ